MSFFLISDTHVNTWSVLPELIVESDYALLAGDIGDPYHESYVNYLIKVSKKYKLVFLITGNN
jgi:predicted phosphodiesterase